MISGAGRSLQRAATNSQIDEKTQKAAFHRTAFCVARNSIMVLIGLALFRRRVGTHRGVHFRASKHKMMCLYFTP
jgi:hypothetical protein